MTSTVQTFAFVSEYFARSLLAFQETLAENAQVRAEMERREKPRTFCEIRLSSRADALYSFRAAYPVLV